MTHQALALRPSSNLQSRAAGRNLRVPVSLISDDAWRGSDSRWLRGEDNGPPKLTDGGVPYVIPPQSCTEKHQVCCIHVSHTHALTLLVSFRHAATLWQGYGHQMLYLQGIRVHECGCWWVPGPPLCIESACTGCRVSICFCMPSSEAHAALQTCGNM